MIKQLTILHLFLFFIITLSQAGSNVFANTPARDAFTTSGIDTIKPNTSTLYLPEDVGMNSVRLARIDSIVKVGIKDKVFPGCQVVVMKEGKPIYDKCFGTYNYEAAQPVKPTTMYDLASLSKTTGTLLAVMKLYDNGKLNLTDKASKYLSFLQGTDKANIKITELLFHESGLPASLPFHRLAIQKNVKPSVATLTPVTTSGVQLRNRVVNPAFKYKDDWVSKFPSAEYALQVSDSFYVSNRFHQAAMKMIADTHLNSKTYCYSCVNFILLKEIAETISGASLDVFLDREFYTPMKLNNMAYLPLRKYKRDDIAPTLKKDFLRNEAIQGYVHDPDAAFLGGVSGNAGLFATAHDVASVYQMLLNKGEMDGKRYLSAETCNIFSTTTSKSGRRNLGYDRPVPRNPKYSPCCISAPPVVYGHTGYTGTCCWVDPANKLVYVFLSNRTYPDDGVNKLAKSGIRTKIQEVIYESIKK